MATLSKQEVQNIIEVIDMNADGAISIQEFSATLAPVLRTIFKDRKVDFFFMDDFVTLLKHYIDSDKTLTFELDLCYSRKYYLSEIAEMINNLSDHNVEIIKQGNYEEYPYCGYSNSIECIEYDGLEKGIGDCYDYYK